MNVSTLSASPGRRRAPRPGRAAPAGVTVRGSRPRMSRSPSRRRPAARRGARSSSRVLRRVVRGGDDRGRRRARASPTAKYSISVPTRPIVDHVGATVGAPSIAASAISGDDSRMSRPTAMRRGSKTSDVGAADAVGPVRVQLVGVDAPDVVGLEDGRVDHGRGLYCRLPRHRAGVRVG